MANSLTFTTPAGENVTFTLTAQAADSAVLFSASFTTASGGTLYLKVFETGDSANPITDYSTMEQGKLYDIEAYSDAGFTTPVDITTWGGTNVTFVGYDFVPDRRPIAAFGFANSSTSDLIAPSTTNAVGMHWGVNSHLYRRTPLAGSDMSDPNTNGRLKYVNNNAAVVAGRGFERVHYWNIAGFTNYQDNQPFYNSNPYTGLGLTEAKYIQNTDDITTAVTSSSPFTVDGISGTAGDSEAAWAYAIQETKDLVTAEGGTPEVGVYFGYRAFYDAADMQTNDRTFLGHNPDWTGTGNSPGFLASTGFDYVDEANPGYSASDEAYNNWFAPELAGLYSMGFDTVGLDVGAKIFLNTKGMITGGSGINDANPPFTTGDDRLIDLFNSYGIKPYAEAIPMETYGINGDLLTGPNAEAYSDIAYMGYWKNSVGYSGLDENGDPLDVISNTCIHNPTGGDGTATVGPNVNANTWDPATTEVHAIIRWGNSDVWPLIGLESDGQGGTNSLGYGWLTMKQVLYDLHTAGMVVGISASVNNSMTDGLGYEITAAEFHQFVQDLAKGPTGPIATRPEAPVPPSGLQQIVTITCDAGGINPGFSATGDKDVWQNGWPGVVNSGYLTWSFGQALELDYPELYDAGTYSSTDGEAFVNKYDYRITKTVAGFPGEDETQDYVGLLSSFGGSAQPAYCRLDFTGTLAAASANGATTWVIDVYAAGDLV